VPKVDNNLFYSKSLNKYGDNARGVHWNSQQTQYKRFEIITSFIIDEIKNVSICDAGCGIGEYYIYLNKYNLLPKEYIGIDIEEQMIELAMQRVDAPFYVQDVLSGNLSIKDYYISSGALNILTKEESYTFITNAFEHSKLGFIFNVLDELKIVDSGIYNGFRLSELLKFCKNLSSNIIVKDGYLDGDFTIFIKK